MKKSKGHVFIKDLQAMRTNNKEEAHDFKTKDEAEKSLCGFAQSGKLFKDLWEIVSPKTKKPMDAAIEKVGADMKEQKEKEDSIKVDIK